MEKIEKFVRQVAPGIDWDDSIFGPAERPIGAPPGFALGIFGGGGGGLFSSSVAFLSTHFPSCSSK